MNLVKTSALSFISTVVKMLSGLVINKAVAIYVGPSGLALIGQFRNFTQLAMLAARGAINSGITKYTAEYGKDDPRLPLLFSTAARISILCSLLVGGTILVASRYLSLAFLKSDDYTYVFCVFGITIILFVLNNLLLSILNGLKDIKSFVKVNIFQSLYTLVFTSVLAGYLGLDGVLLALATNQSVVFFVVLYMLRNDPVIRPSNFLQGFDRQEARKLLGFTAMALVAGIKLPLMHMVVRDYIAKKMGWDAAGHWQAVWFVSTAYLTVVTSTLSVYYLPRLSEIKGRKTLRKEIFQGYVIIVPIMIIASLSIYFLRDFIILILFSPDFSPVRDLFAFQLLGDVLKISSFLLSYLMLAKAMTRTFIIVEILFGFSFVAFSLSFIDLYGLVGVVMGYACNYALYLLAMIFIMRKIVFYRFKYSLKG